MKNQIKSTLLLLFLLFAVNSRSSAQISSITIGVDGFTCSLCAKGVEEQFKSLDFVQSVKHILKDRVCTDIQTKSENSYFKDKGRRK